MNDILRVANCSGFYGDRLSAAREMVEGGPIDVLTGDYLAELTLMLLHKDRAKDPRQGYAKTFLLQLRQVAATCLERNIKIVVNAGGLNPAGCAEACRAVYQELGLEARVAHIEGDDLLERIPDLQKDGESLNHLDQGIPLADLKAPILSANAYLGGWGIAKALERGADLVICPRVTDAALVVGPAAWRFGWARDDWNALASAVVAGHILECGAQATGGNYSFFKDVEGLERPGFPLAEIGPDGSFVVTKHPNTGGEVSIGTVTAQLLYEIDAPRYKNPDVTAHFDTIQLSSDGKDRVRVEGVTGEPPPATTKVCINYPGGFKNSFTFLLNGPDVEEKARLATETLWASLGGRDQFADTEVRLHRAGPATTLDESYSLLTVAVKDPDAKKVGRRFSGAAVEMALASYPGFNMTAPPGRETPFGVYWPALVSNSAVSQRVVFEDASLDIELPNSEQQPEPSTLLDDTVASEATPEAAALHPGDVVTAPLGRVCGARSGDKGGNANLGVWTISDGAYGWLEATLTVERLKELIPETADLEIERYVLPNLRALNFLIRGFLGDGVAASLALDAQAKGLGEHLRSRWVSIPKDLLAS